MEGEVKKSKADPSSCKWYNKKKGVGGNCDPENVEPKNEYSPRINWGTYFKNEATQILWYTDPGFHNNKKYHYKEFKGKIFEKFKNLVRASFIPYIKVKRQEYWLLGSFYDFPQIKTDFGGGCKDESPYNCADRELLEETAGVLNDPVKKAIDENRVKSYIGTKSSKYMDNNVIFMLVDMTDQYEDLNEIGKIKKQIIDKTDPLQKEKFGPLAFYNKLSIYNGYDNYTRLRVLTSYNLTDFVNYYKKQDKSVYYNKYTNKYITNRYYKN